MSKLDVEVEKKGVGDEECIRYLVTALAKSQLHLDNAATTDAEYFALMEFNAVVRHAIKAVMWRQYQKMSLINKIKVLWRNR